MQSFCRHNFSHADASKNAKWPKRKNMDYSKVYHYEDSDLYGRQQRRIQKGTPHTSFFMLKQSMTESKEQRSKRRPLVLPQRKLEKLALKP